MSEVELAALRAQVLLSMKKRDKPKPDKEEGELEEGEIQHQQVVPPYSPPLVSLPDKPSMPQFPLLYLNQQQPGYMESSPARVELAPAPLSAAEIRLAKQRERKARKAQQWIEKQRAKGIHVVPNPNTDFSLKQVGSTGSSSFRAESQQQPPSADGSNAAFTFLRNFELSLPLSTPATDRPNPEPVSSFYAASGTNGTQYSNGQATTPASNGSSLSLVVDYLFIFCMIDCD